MNPTAIQNPESAFQPMVGQLVWSVRRVHGSILMMEFGNPHLTVREPIVASPGASQKVRRNLARRRVTLLGDWHFGIGSARWEIKTENYSITNNDTDTGLVNEALHELDGQILLSAHAGAEADSLILKFDLQASIYLVPFLDIDDEQWSIHGEAGFITVCKTDVGVVSYVLGPNIKFEHELRDE